ncbi:ubiquitin-like domain-containing protein CIP73 isoform X1 [Solanum stenotomum]|uniref:ubiquitin-like domain-containing protein CIP73 isoform X1 n=1 Tax=Solanum stenotomum TaxID=172797 RepID=UPI0020D1EB68|nr:ubiquitin-like domain-containing protein CIP73 isoform X1 [Solanum stenotomum]XP_049390915.1 ubiquitin-like domain-containing protein CIP73 isoform X1 [Solanum stenotomum]
MADQQAVEGSSTSNDSGGSSESTVVLNIKTLDSQTYTFNVDKNLQVSALKDKLASQIGVPVEQQRLIFRGKVLKDNHLLSEYHVENGDTLHLVLRQSQLQAPSGSSTGEATTNNVNRGQEPQPTAGGSRNRIGQISHSVVLGTFNVGDPGEGLVPDLNRVIGAVLNTVGIGNMTGGQLPGVQASAPAPRPQGNESLSQSGSQQSGQAFSGQSLPQVVQIPLGAAIAVPSINLPLLDSLITLSEFMDGMEHVFSRNGYPPNQSPNNAGDPPTVQLPTHDRGLSSPEVLSLALHQAERLFGGQVIAALSHFAGQLERGRVSSDPALRGQVQTESVLIGQVMQHLGALLLELGRTILTLRMGQSPAESSVNAGPAVYISSTGPNPIMVQPFPLQTSSLFGNSAAVPPNPGTFGSLGIGNAPRHVNIHIHAAPITSAVGARSTNGDGAHGERGNGTDSGQSRVLPVGNIMATAVAPRPAVISVSSMPQPGQSDGPSGQECSTVSGAENDVSTQLDETSASGMSVPEPLPAHNVPGREDKMSLGQSSEMSHSKPEASASVGRAQRSSQELGSPDESSSVPLGLGLGGLQPKRRTKQSVVHGINADGSTSSNPNELPQRDERQFLQSLAALAARGNEPAMPSGTHSDRGVMGTIGTGNQNVDGQSEIADAMSSVLQSPALNGLLSGVSQQTGAGSPDLLRNMMQQLTQSPAMMNTVSQIAQQIDTQDLGSMFSGQGGGMDLSRMFQQMMPIVSQALGGISGVPQQIPNIAQRPGENTAVRPTTENVQIDLHEVAQEIENNSPPVEILRSLVQSTESLHHHGSTDESLADELSIEENLADEFMQMLRNDVSQRFKDKEGK